MTMQNKGPAAIVHQSCIGYVCKPHEQLMHMHASLKGIGGSAVLSSMASFQAAECMTGIGASSVGCCDFWRYNAIC